MANETRGARKNVPTFSTPNTTNVANGPEMTYSNLNGQEFEQHTNPIRGAFDESASPRRVSMNEKFENATPNLVRTATKSK